MNKGITLYDNFLNEIYDFNIVIGANNKRGYSSSEVGIIYDRYFIGYENFNNRENDNSISFTKYPLYRLGTFEEVACLDDTEMKLIQMKAVIKVSEPTDSMKFLRYNMMLALKYKGTKSDVPAKVLNKLLEDIVIRGIV